MLLVGVLAVAEQISSSVMVVIIDRGVEGFFGGVHVGVLNSGAEVIFSKKLSSCLSDKALCNVSKGRIGGTPPKPSRTVKGKTLQMNNRISVLDENTLIWKVIVYWLVY